MAPGTFQCTRKENYIFNEFLLSLVVPQSKGIKDNNSP